MKSVVEYYKKSGAGYLVFAAFVFILAYAPRLFNRYFWLDDGNYMVFMETMQNQILGSGRFGVYLTKGLLTGTTLVPSFSLVCFSAVMILGQSVILPFAIFRNEGKHPILVSAVFFALFITYPSFAEQYNFYCQNFEVALGGCAAFLSLVLLKDYMCGERKIAEICAAFALAVFAFGSYQANAFMMVLGIAAVVFLMLESGSRIKAKDYVFILVFLAAVMAAYCLIAFMIRKIMNLNAEYTTSLIMWGKGSVKDCIKNIFYRIKDVFSGNTVFYSKWYPVTVIVFLTAAVAKGIHQKIKSVFYYLMVVLIIVGPVIPSVITGASTVVRTDFCTPFSMSFMWAWLVKTAADAEKANRTVLAVITLIAFLIGFRQAGITNQLFYSADLRYETDFKVLENVTEDLEDVIGPLNSTEKKIIFAGSYAPYTQQNTIKGEFITTSFFNVCDWHEAAFTGNIITMTELMGYDLHNGAVDPDNIKKAEEAITVMPAYPDNGYILSAGDLVIVKLGD